MAHTGFFKYCKLAWLSGPKSEQTIYRRMVRQRPQNIVEIGLGLGVRTLRMFEVAQRYCAADQIRYTGIDLFEGRGPASANLVLKDAYKLLRSQGVNVRLVPGDPGMALRMAAPALTNTDLIVIDSDVSDSDLMPAWNTIRQIAHGHTLVLRQSVGETGKIVEALDLSAIEQLADGLQKRKRAA